MAQPRHTGRRTANLVQVASFKPNAGLEWTVVLLALLAVLAVPWGVTAQDRGTAITRSEGPVVAFAGDVNLGRRQNAVTAEYGPASALAGVPTLAEAELAIVNLESVVASGGEPAEKGEGGPYYFRGRPEMLAVLWGAGIDVVGTANNHSGDYGDDALLEQARLLDDMNLAHAGSGPDLEAACAPVYRHADELLVAFFSVDATMSHFSATAAEPGTCYLSSDDAATWHAHFQPRIEAARKIADVVLVGVHAGPNYESRPGMDEVAISRALIDAGADAVLGSSAHVLQGIEIYQGRPILYDAGNLLFDSRGDPVGSAVFSLILAPSGVRQVWASPIEVGYGATWAVERERAQEILAGLREHSAEMGTTLRIQGHEGVIHLGSPVARHSPPEPALPDPSLLAPPEPLRNPPLDCTVTVVPPEASINPLSIGPLTLIGVTVTPSTITERRMLWVDTYWTTPAPIVGDPWIHLEGRPVDRDAMASWQGDHEPCDWMWPTSRWEPGVIYHDRYGVRPPDELATTELEIIVGLRMEDERLGIDWMVARIPIIIESTRQ
jgi:poly-gamma-glutamate capsule biosynthesis protein CapA/YwtB (metallophosphatase superfamily)